MWAPGFASNVCEHPRIVAEGKTGYLFDPMSPDELADKLYRYYLLGQAEKETLSQNARRFAEKHFSSEKYVTSYENILMSSIHGRMNKG